MYRDIWIINYQLAKNTHLSIKAEIIYYVISIFFTMAMEQPPNLNVGVKIWIKGPADSRSLFGPGDLRLLESLIQSKNLTKSAQDLGYSYKYAWQKLRDLAKKTGLDVVETHRGGYGGGGAMEVTPWGKYLVKIYNEIDDQLTRFKHDVNEYIQKNPFQTENKKI